MSVRTKVSEIFDQFNLRFTGRVIIMECKRGILINASITDMKNVFFFQKDYYSNLVLGIYSKF